MPNSRWNGRAAAQWHHQRSSRPPFTKAFRRGWPDIDWSGARIRREDELILLGRAAGLGRAKLNSAPAKGDRGE